MESLDAGYALLSDVNARNRELQARLRSSLPLLWTSNALVMTSAAGPRRRRAVVEESAVSEADQMLLAVEGQSSLQVSQRYKRRVEWEVARRIARVDRELQQYPPAQRSWNQQRKEVKPAQSLSYKQRANAMGKPEARETAHVGRTVRSVVNFNQQERKYWGKPTGADREVRRVLKHIATSPLRGAAEKKENMKPNAATGAPFKAIDVKTSNEPPMLEEPITTKKDLSEPLDGRSVLEETMENSKTDEPTDALKSTSDASSIKRAETKPDSPRQVSSFPADGILTKEKDSITSLPQHCEEGDMFSIEDYSLRQMKIPAEERPSSSIGRQVLSDFRTMPSVASFGAQPILSGGMGNAGYTRLNSDVLRRLFSDLDTDKDGHVNRIEMCMALHRLQISVPTTKIISFFRHIHSFGAKGARNRHTSHLPMKEMINYKEFVAFVTAAYDQQQQRKAKRHRAPTRNEQVRPLPSPSTSLPIYVHPTNSPRANRYVHTTQPPPRKEEFQVYEVKDTDSEQSEAAIEDRVIKEIPDFLVSRILEDTSNAASMEDKETAASVVRRSLESLVGKEAVNDKIVGEITQELIRERLRNIVALNQDATEDITGLKRAEAYYNEKMTQGSAEFGSAAEDASSELSVNWVDVLTEEQVSGLVHQIWKDRHALRQVSLTPVVDVRTEDSPDMPEDPIVRWIDEATDTNELLTPPTLSEKAVQAFEEDNLEEPSSVPEDVAITAFEDDHERIAIVPESTCHPQTHLGKAILDSFGGSDSSRELHRPVTSIEILQQLRQQRRLHQSTLPNQQTPSNVIKNPGPNVSVREQIIGVQVNSLDAESVFSSEEDRVSVSESDEEQVHLINMAEKEDLEYQPITEPVPLTHKALDLDESLSNKSSFELAKSMSVSSSGVSSSSEYHHAYGMYREIDRQIHSKTRASRDHRHLYRRQRRLSVSRNSVPDSIYSAELSEGELSHEEALDLSDGEIFGESKKAYARCNNAISSVMVSKEEDNLHSSTECGELPPLIKAHANFRRQLVAQSTSSSFESGELEDGAIPEK
ncbi:hypothetical protein F443_07942 [Phytophthora nicotianae P1569]|uniref:EF-hand domain-containing protein n=1 Tax=Phytophthora nicotianae P1569 TaxID=1317065 RepID=V9FA10_PHYNI|nr:hypothetical protein F443_07942 [Phytophthora nicotianae P1569]